MRILKLNIPDSLEIDDREVSVLVATRLYEQGNLSLGQTAEIVGLIKRTFADAAKLGLAQTENQ